MADTLAPHPLVPRSPLHSWATRLSAMPPTARLEEEPFVAMVDLWVEPGTPGVALVERVIGFGLPIVPSNRTQGPDATAIWFGPQEWLITSDSRDPDALESRLNEAVAESGGAATNVSAQRTTLRLRGAHARDVLAKGCSLDLHPKVFGTDFAAQTMLGLAAVVLIPLDDNGTDYRILVRSSFAGYLAEWLIDAAEEFTVEW